jgi:very-short-patch-repair endonuclease
VSARRALAASSIAGGCNSDTPQGAAITSEVLVRRILAAPKRSVLAVSGTTSETIRAELDRIEDCVGRVFFLKFPSVDTADGIVERVITVLAETALRLWPVWFDDVSFELAANDKAGRHAVAETVRNTATTTPCLLLPWAQKAAQLALSGRAPRVRKTTAATELAQLSLAISRNGLVLLFDCDDLLSNERIRQAAVAALEWIAAHGDAAVIALFSEQPPFMPPFDRILYGAMRVEPQACAPAIVKKADAPWIAPWRGKPHPLSDVELRLFNALGRDRELASLFTFNTLIETVGGTRPKVDLLWQDGRLVVELDGYGSHGNRSAFFDDRRRDYELIRSGYIVLRLVNEEIEQDLELAMEKVRSVVRLRQPHPGRNA